MASLLAELVQSGSTKSDGTVNATGTVFAYLPGTTTPANLYTDEDLTAIATQPIVLDNGGRVNRSTYPDGLWITQSVRLLVQDSSGAIVSDSTYMPSDAGDTAVENDGFTDSTLDGVLTKAFTSFGGQDWLVKESGGATSRTVKAKVFEQGISVKDFGAVGDGVAVDTTAIQAALNRAKVLSTNVLFPAGTYKTDQALTLTSATGVQIIGAGHAATTIKPTHATANAFTFTSSTGCGIHGLSILHTSGSTGAGVLASASLNFSASDVVILANATYVGFAYGMDFSGNGTIDYLTNCYSINGSTRAVRLGNAGTSQAQIISGCQIGASGAAPVSPASGLEFSAAGGTYFLTGNGITGNTNNVLFSVMPTAKFVSNSIASVLGSVSFSGATAALFPQIANGVDGYTVDVTSGGTATPDLTKGNHIRIRATSTGAAITIAAPIPAPASGQFGVWMFLDIFNNAGGAISNPYTMNAAYHLVTVPNQTDLNHNQYLLLWDASSSVWRQVSLAVTT